MRIVIAKPIDKNSLLINLNKLLLLLHDLILPGNQVQINSSLLLQSNNISKSTLLLILSS